MAVNCSNVPEVYKGNSIPYKPTGGCVWWCFTSFSDKEPIFNESIMKYLMFQREKCPTTGKLHWQGFVGFHRKKRLNQVVECIGDKCRCFNMKGSINDNVKYCSKSESRVGDPVVFGTLNKLDDLNKMSVNEFLIKYPEMCWRVNGLDRLKLAMKDKDLKNLKRNVTTIVIVGRAGSGKTHMAHLLGGGDMYCYDYLSNDRVYFDGYDGEKTLLLDDFYGQLSMDYMLRLLDDFPLKLNCRGKYVWAQFTQVIITSNKSPDDWYSCKLPPEMWRRIDELIDGDGLVTPPRAPSGALMPSR